MAKGVLGSAKGAHLLSALKNKLAAKEQPKAEHPKSSDSTDFTAAFAARVSNGVRAPSPTPAKKSKKPPKEVIRLPRRLHEPIVAEAQSQASRQAAPTARPRALYDMGRSDFEQVLRTHAQQGLNAFVATHRAPDFLDATQAELIQSRIESGATQFKDLIDPTGIAFVVGYDFGTSTTKVVVRDPYQALRTAFAVQVPSGMSCGGPHLWPSVVWWDPKNGLFSLAPKPGCIRLDSFKSALIEGNGNRICAASGVTMEQAAIAFLAMQLAYVFGTCRTQQPSFMLGGINFGVPVAALAETSIVRTFKSVLSTGLMLVDKAAHLTLEEIRSAQSQPLELLVEPFVTTELSGAIAGYCSAPRHHMGGHMIIDCGSATLDMASFLLGEEIRPLGIYGARVEPLGADACAAYQRERLSEDVCRGASRYEEHLVFSKAVERDRTSFAETARVFPYQVILTGGGIHSAVHAPLLKTMEKAFERPFYHPILSEDLDYDPASEPARLVLADGLARNPGDFKDVVMPGDRPQVRAEQPEMVTKDQV